ncbi:hypothetical protein Q428_10530 [Fervidicella metallireducens AeB]|uniref:PPM-type phosphatase domain-containing protein n=1 Tax=Fervidicella metallireducens AeB TaxID=1403537 RepID=A0A017RTF9_9CLOT|nr:stage II sporulation protein E [Fervidicella metallireducens]EYE87947.1 hypothetical protein Q428_10530 [Fervidicella metallireducens AeB]
MIYQQEILPYKRVTKNNNQKTKKELKLISVSHIALYATVFFASRAVMLKGLMPFGIAMFTAAAGVLDRQLALLTGIFGVLGYISLLKGYVSLSRAVSLIITMMFIFFIKEKDKNRIYKISAIAFVVNMCINLLFHIYFISGGFVLYDGLLIFFESIIITASSYIFSYALPLYFQNKKRKVLSREEIVCLGLVISLAIAGTLDIKYQYFSLKNMIAFIVVLFSGYIEGPGAGAAVGVALGLVSSISDPAMPVAIGIYSFCGLISGIFKEVGKIITALAFVLSAVLLSMYTTEILNIKAVYMDTLLPALIFLIIPGRKIEKTALLVDGDKRALEFQKSYIDRVKDMMSVKLTRLSEALVGLSEILEENVNNELKKKSEINGMVEKLADKVCASCESRGQCWKKELYCTYESFIELLRNAERIGRVGINEMPEDMRRKCLRPNEMVKQVNHVIELFRLNNKWKRKLINSRVIVSEQIKGISSLMEDIVGEFSSNMEFKNDIEEEIAVALDRKGLEFSDILAIKNNRHKYEVTVYTKPCSGQQSCTKDYMGVISRCLGVKMVRDKSNCKIKEDCSLCQFRMIEAENYNIATAVSKCAKEDISGDCHSFGNIGEGRYMIAISDGMGSGSSAAIESNTTISLLEKFMEAGFERNAAIKAINSVLVLRSCEESFATIDMGLIDMYSGIGEFIKIGAAPTFIKSGRNVEIIKSTSLPVGILDEVDIESQIVEFKNGDMIVMVTDGIVDANEDLKEKWIVNALREFESGNPKDVSDYILNKAREYYGGKVQDDMTVIVSKIWKVM